MKAIILARVSSKEQEEGQSIPAQVRRLTEYAMAKNLTIAETYQLTESSTKETRKQFDAIIAHIKKEKAPVALITDTVDRLQRSFRETPLLDELRKKGKLELHFLREGLIISKDSNSAQLLQWDIGVLFASSYVRQLSDNIKRSIEQGLRNGNWYSKAPFGYKNVRTETGDKSIEVNEHEAEYVKQIFVMYASGEHSLKTIAAEMNNKGLKNTHGRPFLHSKIETILKNPFYCGYMRVKNVLYEHRYPTLISIDLFEQVQAQLKGYKKAPVRQMGKNFIFKGLVKCKNCGCSVSGDIKKGKYVYYVCNNSKGKCKKKWVREKILIDKVLPYLEKIRLDEEQIREVIIFLKKLYGREQEYFKKEQRRLREELDLTQARVSKLIDMHLDGAIDADTYHQKLNEYKTKQRDIMQEMQTYMDTDENILYTAKNVFDLARATKELFLSSKNENKRQILKIIFSNFQLNHETLELEVNEPFLSMSKIRNHPAWWS